MNPHLDKVREFLDAFEEVFDRDWPYTKEMLGIRDGKSGLKTAAAEPDLEVVPVIAEGGTFVYPEVENEIEDLGNRARLLQAYRALRKDLP